MPYPKTSTGYPASMRALIDEVCADNLGRRIPLASEREARGLRARYYQYLAAIKRDLNHPPAWMTKADIEDLKAFVKRFMTVQFRLEGTSFIIEPRDETPIADALRTAEVMPPRDGSPPTPKEDAAVSVLESLIRKTK